MILCQTLEAKAGIILRKVGQTKRGAMVDIPNTIKELIENAKEVLKEPTIVEIWNESEITITNIALLTPGGIYYAASQKDLDE